MKPERKGKMFPEYWVECLFCPAQIDTGESTKDRASLSINRKGWRAVKAGWVCPQCSAERKL